MTKLTAALNTVTNATAEVNQQRPTRGQPLRMIAFVDQNKK